MTQTLFQSIQSVEQTTYLDADYNKTLCELVMTRNAKQNKKKNTVQFDFLVFC